MKHINKLTKSGGAFYPTLLNQASTKQLERQKNNWTYQWSNTIWGIGKQQWNKYVRRKYKQTSSVYAINGKNNTSGTSEKKEKAWYGYVCIY